MLNKCISLPELETERLVLRDLHPEDIEDLKRWITLDEMYTYWGQPATEEEKHPERLLSDPSERADRKPNDDMIWWIEEKSSRRVIGEIEIYDLTDGRICMIGYRISPEFQHAGFATEAISAVIRYMFTETAIDRIQTYVDVRNSASNKALEKCGFLREGTVRHGKMIEMYCDYNIWGLLREDFEEIVC